MQHASDSAIKSKFAAADRINGHSGRVWRIFDRELYVDLHRHIAKEPAFHANKCNFVIELPRDIVARSNVNIFIRQAIADNRLHGLGL